jgi:hypothetical protein
MKLTNESSVWTKNSTSCPWTCSVLRIGAGRPVSKTIRSRSDDGVSSPRAVLPATSPPSASGNRASRISRGDTLCRTNHSRGCAQRQSATNVRHRYTSIGAVTFPGNGSKLINFSGGPSRAHPDSSAASRAAVAADSSPHPPGRRAARIPTDPWRTGTATTSTPHRWPRSRSAAPQYARGARRGSPTAARPAPRHPPDPTGPSGCHRSSAHRTSVTLHAPPPQRERTTEPSPTSPSENAGLVLQRGDHSALVMTTTRSIRRREMKSTL